MKEIEISGVGFHSGKKAVATVAAKDSGGIVFIRNGVRVPALYKNVSDTRLRNTTVGTPPDSVSTIEHFMAAMFVRGIANAEIGIDGPEMPILDGSAAELIKRLKDLDVAGRAPLLRVKKGVAATQRELDGKIPLWKKIFNFITGRKRDGFVKIAPMDGNRLKITARLVYRENIIGDQKRSFVFDYDDFAASAESFDSQIAKSRTFGKVGEWEWLKKHGMAGGADKHNLIALGTIDELKRLQRLGLGLDLKAEDMAPAGEDDEVVALTGLRYPDEFVRHKIIDVVGDLYTSGARIAGKIDSFKGSHALNNLALRKLFGDAENYDIIKPEE
ncbi:MAG: UDP-3-O-acyl-N-acetylglucosamine deacetylase [Rickettsiales bacterium]|jgi:UDP-3-O-[3-hydroxymyristoyl] N-acetylglucosamine deacetylase|nr:UDP-3-O-acyl-N-acetylglucosamine deacetylase [Rickettsiales bacterium]